MLSHGSVTAIGVFWSDALFVFVVRLFFFVCMIVKGCRVTLLIVQYAIGLHRERS